VQEAIDLTVLAFDLAEKYRAIVIVLADGSIGQMMEPAEMPPMRPQVTEYPAWSVRGATDRERRILSSIYIDPVDEEVMNYRLMVRWSNIEASEVRYAEYHLDDAEYAVVGFGTAGRVALSAVRAARSEGVRVGLLRPISMSPFPVERLDEITQQVKGLLVVEMNAGQMLEDVLRVVKNRVPVEFYGRMGGIMPFPDEIYTEIQRLVTAPATQNGNPRNRWLSRFESVIAEARKK
jgi:2-oxoglutarate ferredoxin oxidoreductase subunit alpha